MKVFAAAAALALALLGSADAGRVKVKGSKDPSPAHEKEVRIFHLNLVCARPSSEQDSSWGGSGWVERGRGERERRARLV